MKAIDGRYEGTNFEVLDVWGRIDAIKLEDVPVQHIERHVGQEERTKLIRSLMKTLGLKGISVRKATGAQCYWTYITVPKMAYDPKVSQAERENIWELEYKAKEKIESIILAAFPSFEDRSDPQTDYFSFVFMVS